MKRFNGIDTIRGFSMWMMVAGHIMAWWIRTDYSWHRLQVYSFLEPICATGFLFASGVSAAISYKVQLSKIKESNKFTLLRIRNEYFFRAILILGIGFIYNFFVALFLGDYLFIWSWFVLQTIGFSLIFAWPLLRTSIHFRLILGFIILVINTFVFDFLNMYRDQANFYGIIYHFLYNPSNQYTILSFFSVFLIGTTIGEILFNFNLIENQIERKLIFKHKFIFPTLIFGGFLLIFGISFVFPTFLDHTTFSSMLYSLGVVLILLSILIGVQEFEKLKKKRSYKFLFYYSYYSFTIYLGHNILYFLLTDQLNIFTVWVALIITTVLLGLLFNLSYRKLGRKISLKTYIGMLSYILAKRIEGKPIVEYEKIKKIH